MMSSSPVVGAASRRMNAYDLLSRLRRSSAAGGLTRDMWRRRTRATNKEEPADAIRDPVATLRTRAHPWRHSQRAPVRQSDRAGTTRAPNVPTAHFASRWRDRQRSLCVWRSPAFSQPLDGRRASALSALGGLGRYLPASRKVTWDLQRPGGRSQPAGMASWLQRCCFSLPPAPWSGPQTRRRIRPRRRSAKRRRRQ